MTKEPNEAESVIVLGCQVTDLAILNDLRNIEKLRNEYPEKIFYMSGCLAQRFDVELPHWIRRLDVVRIEYQPLDKLDLIDYANPFWVKDFKLSDDEFANGNLFRNMYPLKIGAGCHGKCKYCTIRDTRGETFSADPHKQIDEFLAHEDIVLIADSPIVFINKKV